MKNSNTILKQIICFAFFATISVGFSFAQPVKKLTANYLRTDFLMNPTGVDQAVPRLSWEVLSPHSNIMQSAYQIRASLSEKDLASDKNLVWSTGKINTEQSLYIEYQGKQLQSGQRIYWQVKIWDNRNNSSDWSQPVFFEMGLLQPSDWKAAWIEPDLVEDTLGMNPAPLLRKDFELQKTIRSARLYITSHGVYQVSLNGNKVGDELFTPGWTSYNKRLQYQVYDITSSLKQGKNAIGITLGDGWYRGFLAWAKNRYGKTLGTMAQVKVIYNDGTEELITTDGSWKCSTGPILASDLYHGESYDARLDKPGWTTWKFSGCSH